MRLLRSEFLRARSRRLVPMVLIGGLIGIVIGMGIVAFTANKPSPAELAQAQASFDKQVARCERDIATSQGQVAELPSGSTTPQAFCERAWSPGFDAVFLRDLDTILQGTATFVILLAVFLGASLGGADWTSNTMQTLLTWEPRRFRVFLVRALVVAVCVFAITVFLQLVFAAVTGLVASTRGSADFLPSDFWRSLLLTIERVSVMSTAFALIAFAISMIGRSTVAALGALFGYLIVVEAVIAGFRPSLQGNMLLRAAIVVITHQPILDPEAFGATGSALLLDVPKAWGVVGIYTLAIGLLGIVIFRRRDVT
jgi:ABC-2 type transport system permease protein